MFLQTDNFINCIYIIIGILFIYFPQTTLHFTRENVVEDVIKFYISEANTSFFAGDKRLVNVHFCKATQMQHSYFKYRLINGSFRLFLSQISYPFYFQKCYLHACQMAEQGKCASVAKQL